MAVMSLLRDNVGKTAEGARRNYASCGFAHSCGLTSSVGCMTASVVFL